MLLLLPPTKSVLKQTEVPATVSSFYVSVLYTAMLRTSIAGVLGCLYFCPLDCDNPVMFVDCAAVETRCMLNKKKNCTPAASATTKRDIYVPGTDTIFSFHFPFDEIYRRLLFFTLGRSVSA